MKKTMIAIPIAILMFALVTAGCSSDGSNTTADTTNGTTTSSSGNTAAPVADFIVARTSGSASLAVTFTDASTGSIDSWSWSFGDGATSTSENPSHTYTNAGAYTVSLTVIGPGGTDTATRTENITVSPKTSPSAQLSYPIVDTGQSVFYGNNQELATAPSSPNDAFYGQDAQYAGNQPAYRDNGDGTVTDLNTGLMWVQARGDKVSWADAKAGAATCTVGGYTDWRMPTIKELYSLINFNGKSGPTDATSIPYIDTNYFGFAFGDTNPNESMNTVGNRVIDGQDWSATEYVSTTMQGDEAVFGVNFIDGRIKGYPVFNPATGDPTTKYVRYVRGNPDYGINNFVDNGDGTITDTATGLMWAQADSGTGMNWEDALAWVQQQNAADYLGYNDWRLPNAKELQSIVDYTRSPDTTDSAAIDPLFQCTAITNEGGQKDWPWYWTGTTHLDNMGAVYVAFGRALGWMEFGPDDYYTLADVHGAGAQRSDPKSGSVTDYYLGSDINGNPVYGRGPQGDVIRIDNFVRLVRNAN